MAEHRNYITPRGYKRHRDEYQWLRVVVRPRIVEEVAHAASLGDRSENAEYIYGKKKLREVDRRLRHLARRMGACEVVDPAIDRGDTVFFGATVTLAWPDGAERRFEVIGEDEIEAASADSAQGGEAGRISWRSPLGQALLRRREGDTVSFRSGPEARVVRLEILEVAYLSQTADPPSDWEQHQAEMRTRAALRGESVVEPPLDLAALEDAAEADDANEARPEPAAASETSNMDVASVIVAVGSR